MQIDGAPTTSMMAVDAPILSGKAGLGSFVVHDRIGVSRDLTWQVISPTMCAPHSEHLVVRFTRRGLHLLSSIGGPHLLGHQRPGIPRQYQ